jgi:hypothetical protein
MANQSFFTEDVNHERYHELSLYFLIDVSDTDLLSKETNFVLLKMGGIIMLFHGCHLAN